MASESIHLFSVPRSPHWCNIKNEEHHDHHEAHRSPFGCCCFQRCVLQRKRGNCSKNDFQHVHVCLYCEGSAGRISPCSEGPPAVSLGCRSHSWAPRSQTAPPSGELPARANTLSSFSETAMLTRGFLSCAAVSGTTWTTVGMWEKTETRTSFIIEVTPIFYPSSTPNRKEKQLLPKPPVGLQTTGSSDSLLSHHWYRTYFLFQSDRAEYRWQNIIISQSSWSLIFRVYFFW